MKVNAQRLWDNHEKLASFTDSNLPYTRRSFTPFYKKARLWLEKQFKEINLQTSYDAAGNLTALYKGETSNYIATGSHTDTVNAGGRFDGISGVLSFLEVAKTFYENKYKPKKGILGIDFLAEEPSEFGLSCIGSRLSTGNFNDNMMKLIHSQTKETLINTIDKWGGNSKLLSQGQSIFDTSKLDGYLELHIEQGKILESKGLDIGLVTGICSVTRYNFVVNGKADHAGNTPMNMRADSIVCAAKIIDKISDIALKSLKYKSYYTATVGKISAYPNGSNVIAKKVDFTLDIRSDNNDLVKDNLEILFDFIKKVEKQTKTKVEFQKISQSKPSFSDKNLLDILEEDVKKLGYSYTRLLSGAGHDAAYMSTITPMVMIFIPCEGGRSHLPQEFSSKEQLEKGANLLLKSIVSLTS